MRCKVNNLQEVYEEAYKYAWNGRKHNEVAITVETQKESKTFIEKDFYYCGFNWINFKVKGENRELYKTIKKQGIYLTKNYYGGMNMRFNELGSKGNGDYYIQIKAYDKVAEYLNKLGYEVRADGMLD